MFSQDMSTNTHVHLLLHYLHPRNLIVKWLRIDLMIAIINTIAFHPIVTWKNSVFAKKQLQNVQARDRICIPG